MLTSYIDFFSLETFPISHCTFLRAMANSFHVLLPSEPGWDGGAGGKKY